MTLGEKQELFTGCLSELLRYAHSHGYKIRLKSLDGGTHMKGSLHYVGLALDIALFKNGQYISDGGDPAWTDLGTFWESLDSLCRWGGRFKSVDSNHFSIAHEGKA